MAVLREMHIDYQLGHPDMLQQLVFLTFLRIPHLFWLF